MIDSFIDVLGYIAAKYVALLARCLPLRVALRLGAWCGTLVYMFHRRRRVAYVNLKAAFSARYSPAQLRRIARRTYENIAQTGVELFRAPILSEAYVEKYITIHGFERIAHEVNKGKGLIFLTAHFGNWELLALVSALKKFPMKVLAREQKHSRLNDLLNDFRCANGNEVIGKGMAVREIVQALRNNDIVGILSDQSGGPNGVYVNFFGRETTTPPGVISIAQRTGCSVLPAFMVRHEAGRHHIYIEEPLHIPHTESDKDDIKKGLENYIHVLERFTKEYPDQWLWGHKRWKYTLNKRIVVLSDGKPGHQSQSQAVMALFTQLAKERQLILDMEMCAVTYKSAWHRMFLFCCAPVVAPWIQGRIGLLRAFLTEESYHSVAVKHADIIVSCGSSTTPVQLLLQRENDAKTVAIMKPPFPYNAYFYHVLIAPFHDSIKKVRKNIVRVKTALTSLNRELMAQEGERLWRAYQLPTRGIMSVFIGGDTHGYRYSMEYVNTFLASCIQIAEKKKSVLIITTSRRTRPDVIEAIKKGVGQHPLCKMLVIPTENAIPNVVYGMLSVADSVMVTEDSVSMVSESIQSGKSVFVLAMAPKGLPRKHKRFHEVLVAEGLVERVTPHELYDRYMTTSPKTTHTGLHEREREQVLNALRNLL